jgi:hypothetical protein
VISKISHISRVAMKARINSFLLRIGINLFSLLYSRIQIDLLEGYLKKKLKILHPPLHALVPVHGTQQRIIVKDSVSSGSSFIPSAVMCSHVYCSMSIEVWLFLFQPA